MAATCESEAQIEKYILKVKTTSSCFCGESDPVCLQFHHRDPRKKKFAISDARKSGRTLKEVKIEIDKCDLICANCHLKRHSVVRVNRSPNRPHLGSFRFLSAGQVSKILRKEIKCSQ